MQTSFSRLADERLMQFSVGLAAAARLFTVRQLAQHPDLSWRAQPERRARDFLRAHLDVFEGVGAPRGEHVRWRLTKEARRHYGVSQAAVQGLSEKAYHWLGLGDVWSVLTFAGGRPEEWQTDVDHQFDALFIWQRTLYLLEYQRSPLTACRWAQKWEQRREWYRAQQWPQRPWVVLLNATGQQESSVRPPSNTIHVRSIEELPGRLLSLLQTSSRA